MIRLQEAFAAAILASLLGSFEPAAAQDNEAKAAFKAMSDFLVSQKSLAVSYDATLEIVTADLEKVALASSGTLTASRPDKIRATRTGGIADVELVYDGKVLSAYGKNLNIYAKLPVEGSLDDLIDKLRTDLGLELPAADILSANPFDIMMSNVTEAKGLGEGVIRGQVCDHLAFRTADVDWQIWLAQGGKPFPCRFSITSKMAVHAPTYSIEFANWKSGADVAADDFQLKPAAGAKEVALDELEGLDEAPAVATEGDAQ
jgi:hypothetical protein